LHDFVAVQKEYARHADAARFAWQTEAPWFAATERALLAGVRAGAGERLLEIGCGEGGNLQHLRALGATRFGIDFSTAKAAFAARSTGAHVTAADASRLPFADASFDAILIRDLLHHLPDRARALGEARRVLKPGGRLTLIEPNRGSPLVLLQAAVVPAERGLLASTAERLRGELAAAGFTVDTERTSQPLPIARVLLHRSLGTARLGAARFGAIGVVARALDAFDALAARVIPRGAWLYLIFEARRT
jgi:ubiquinone/menaquinone biosynthesis C-methylase UbiE